jgi:phosphoadenosine phosphosulfate reductase
MLTELRISDEGNIEEYDKVQIAIDRLREFEPPEGYYLAFSGGKDSVVIYDLAVRSGVKFDAHYDLTTVDPPELVSFIKREYPAVEIHRPEKTMWQLIVENGMPPTRLVRYCCRILKERGGQGRRTITGVRWAESVRRKSRRMVENCLDDGTRTFLHIIIEWEDEDVWNYIHANNVKYCHLYDEGFKRLGCVMCPMGNTKQMLQHAERFPAIYRAYERAFDKMLIARTDGGLKNNWHSGAEVMQWWIYNPPKGDPDQGVLFE